MSKMIQAGEGCYIAADQVAEVKISQSSQTLMIKTKDGSHYSRAPEYRQSVYAPPLHASPFITLHAGRHSNVRTNTRVKAGSA